MVFGGFKWDYFERFGFILKMKWRWENEGTAGLIRQKTTHLNKITPPSTKKLTSSLRTRYQIRHGQTLYCYFSTHPPPIRQNSKGSDIWLKTFFDKILHSLPSFLTLLHLSPYSPTIHHNSPTIPPIIPHFFFLTYHDSTNNPP